MSKLRDMVSNKTFVIFGGIFLLFMIFVEIKQLRQRYEVQKEISDLNNQADQLQKKNNDLQSFLAYLQTDDYKEKAARQQLNLRKDGEFVYSFAANDQQMNAAAAGQVQDQGSVGTNIKSWWNYFFHPGQ